jgi:O-antigen/teichoic acid export membrane protein
MTSDANKTSSGGLWSKLVGLLGDSATYGLSSVLVQFVQFLLLPVYTRYLSPPENGIIAMLAIVAMLFGPLANLGMTNAVFRRFNQAADENTARTVLGTGLLSVVAGSLVWLVIAVVFADWIAADFVGDANTTGLVRLCLLSAAINTIAQVPNITLRARRRVRTAAGLNLASVIISICTTILFVVGFEMGVKGWVLGMLAADLTLLVLAFACTWGSFDLRLDRTVWKSMISYGLPFVPHRLQAVALAQFSQYMVREMLGLGDAGIYSIATKFALPVGVTVNAIQEAWVPFKFQIHSQESDARPYFRSIFTYYFAAIMYLWVGVSLWGFDVVRLMTAPDYHAAAMLVPVLALLRVSQGVYFMLGTGIELTDRTAAFPMISLAGLVTVVAAAFVLIEPFGAVGAAAASVICWVVMAAILFWLAQRCYPIAYEWPTIGWVAIAAAACVAAGYAIQPAVLGVRLAVYLAISLTFPLGVLWLLLRSPVERDRMHLLLARFRGLRGPATPASAAPSSGRATKLAVLDVGRCDSAVLRPWWSDAQCVALSVNPLVDLDWRRPPVAMTRYDDVAQRYFQVFETVFAAGASDVGPRLPGAEVSFLAAADFTLFIENRHAMVLLADLERLLGEHDIKQIEFITDQADGGKFDDAIRAFGESHRLPVRRVLLNRRRRGVLRTLSAALDVAAGAVSIHGTAYLDYVRAVMRRQFYTLKRPSRKTSTRSQSAGLPAEDKIRVAMLVYHVKSWRYLLPIRKALVEAGHEVLMISPRLECDKMLDQVGVDYVPLRATVPKLRLRRAVTSFLNRLNWSDPDPLLNALIKPDGALRRLITLRGLAACEIYGQLAEPIVDLLRRHQIDVVMSTDSGSVAARCFFRTAERLNRQCVFVQHGSVFSIVGVRQYMLQSHRLLWGSNSCDSLARCGVEHPERIVCLGSPFHEERYRWNGNRATNDVAPDAPVLATFGVPGGYVGEGTFRRAASYVLQAAARFPTVPFIIKPHPGDPGHVWRQLMADLNLPNVKIVSDQDTYELMRGCRVLLTMFSTTGSEAICLGRPVVSVNPDARRGGEEYLEAGAAYSVQTAEELCDVLESLFESAPGSDRLAEVRRRFTESFFHREERPAAQRTVEFLENLVREPVAQPAPGR